MRGLAKLCWHVCGGGFSRCPGCMQGVFALWKSRDKGTAIKPGNYHVHLKRAGLAYWGLFWDTLQSTGTHGDSPCYLRLSPDLHLFREFPICCSPVSNVRTNFLTAERKANSRCDKSQPYILIRKKEKQNKTLFCRISRGGEVLGWPAWGGNWVCNRGDL